MAKSRLAFRIASIKVRLVHNKKNLMLCVATTNASLTVGFSLPPERSLE